MGVDRTDYLMFGVEVKLDDEFDWEKFEAEINGSPDRRFDMVYDGMSGAYCYAGKILFEIDEDEGHVVNKISLDSIKGTSDILAFVLTKALGYHVSPQDISLILFSHYH